jgi:feruloyl esterase
LELQDTTITAAQSVPAGTYTAPDGEVFTNLPGFCRVAATLTPTPDSNIKIEVWLPYSGWNGRYVGTGNGGIGGQFFYNSLAHFLALNYAVANTDMGTSPAATDPLGGRVLTGHPEKQIDYATRSTNLMTVRAKEIIRAFMASARDIRISSDARSAAGKPCTRLFNSLAITTVSSRARP